MRQRLVIEERGDQFALTPRELRAPCVPGLADDVERHRRSALHGSLEPGDVDDPIVFGDEDERLVAGATYLCEFVAQVRANPRAAREWLARTWLSKFAFAATGSTFFPSTIRRL